METKWLCRFTDRWTFIWCIGRAIKLHFLPIKFKSFGVRLRGTDIYETVKFAEPQCNYDSILIHISGCQCQWHLGCQCQWKIDRHAHCLGDTSSVKIFFFSFLLKFGLIAPKTVLSTETVNHVHFFITGMFLLCKSLLYKENINDICKI